MQHTIERMRLQRGDALTCAVFLAVALTLLFPDASLSALTALVVLRWLAAS